MRIDSQNESSAHVPNYATNVTHLLWADRWIEVVKTADGWLFKTGRDAADWLLA